jgi:hypothetical protein
MGLPSINALPMSDVCADRIQRQVSEAEQTIGRLGRILVAAKKAAQRGSVKAELAIAVANDELYSLLSELRLDESEWG